LACSPLPRSPTTPMRRSSTRSRCSTVPASRATSTPQWRCCGRRRARAAPSRKTASRTCLPSDAAWTPIPSPPSSGTSSPSPAESATFPSIPSCNSKGPANFVSAADHRAEETLQAELEHARPGYGFVGEEGGVREGSDKTHRWIADPLDGTLNFLHSIPHFAISLALEREGAIIAGVI